MRSTMEPMGQARRVERFERLHAEHGRALLGYLLRRAPSDDAVDVLAEVLLSVWRRLEDVPDGAGARPWLYGVARRSLANHRRSGRRRDQLTERLRAQVREAVPEGWEDEVGERDLVALALGRLHEHDREVLQLTAWEGLAPAEIAMALHLPAPTVRSRLRRARLRLLVELEALGAAPEPAGAATTAAAVPTAPTCPTPSHAEEAS